MIPLVTTAWLVAGDFFPSHLNLPTTNNLRRRLCANCRTPVIVVAPSRSASCTNCTLLWSPSLCVFFFLALPSPSPLSSSSSSSSLLTNRPACFPLRRRFSLFPLHSSWIQAPCANHDYLDLHFFFSPSVVQCFRLRSGSSPTAVAVPSLHSLASAWLGGLVGTARVDSLQHRSVLG